MVANTILASIVIFLICFCAPASLFSVFPEILALGVLLAGFFWGPHLVFAMLPACWTVLSAAWVIEDRLAPELQGLDLSLTGVVCDIPKVDGRVQRFPFVIDADERVSGIPARTFISWYDSETPVRAGERWHLTIRLKRPRGTMNPAGFDFERWAFMRDIGATGYVRHSVANRRLPPAGGGCELAAFRQRIASDLVAAIPEGKALGHLLALAVGIRNRLDDDDWKVLRRTGTAHLMAISGLHIGLAAGFAFFCFRQVGRWLLLVHINCRPLVFARAGALAGAMSYSALAGFSVPTVRAVVMTCAVILLTGLRRTIPAPAVLAVALYAILWIEPFAMLAAGFWLSFGAVFVLLLSGFGRTYPGTPGAESHSRATDALHRFWQLLRAQLCLSVGLLPATAFFFGQVSLVAPVANLLVVPLFGVSIVPLLIVGVIALIVAPALASPVLGLADFILSNVIVLLEGLNRWAPIAVDLPEVPGLVAAICAIIVAVLIWPPPLPARISAVMLLLGLAALAGSGTRQASPALRIVVMDVGQGLAVLLQTPGHAVLFDSGPRYRRGDAGRSVVVPVLRYFGVSQLDHLIISHGDADHVGGARSVLAAYPEAIFTAPERLDVPSDRFRTCRAGQHWRHDGVSFRFLHPGQEADSGTWSENDASCVLLVQSAHVGLLLPGDIEQHAERWLVASGTLPAVDLVVAPHHGSRTSSTQTFVAATQPDFVVFSAGYQNQWRFPAPDVQGRWVAGNACALTTGDAGALVFEAHGTGPLQLVKRYRLDEARVWNETDPAGPATRRCRPWDSTN